MLGIPWTGVGYQFDDVDDDPPTLPPVGIAKLTIEQETNALFFSATWIVRARVDGKIIAESDELSSALPDGLVRQWARAFIRKHYMALRRRGIDVDAAYVAWGGATNDL